MAIEYLTLRSPRVNLNPHDVASVYGIRNETPKLTPFAAPKGALSTFGTAGRY
jgi:hypothetical protein